MKKIQVGAGAFPHAGGVVQPLNTHLPELVPLHVPLHNRPEVSISPLSIPMLSSHTEHSPLTHTNHTSLQFQH